jgi:hypothetical protein
VVRQARSLVASTPDRLDGEVAQVTADAAEYFRLPRDRTVIMGSRIEL